VEPRQHGRTYPLGRAVSKRFAVPARASKSRRRTRVLSAAGGGPGASSGLAAGSVSREGVGVLQGRELVGVKVEAPREAQQLQLSGVISRSRGERIRDRAESTPRVCAPPPGLRSNFLEEGVTWIEMPLRSGVSWTSNWK